MTYTGNFMIHDALSEYFKYGTDRRKAIYFAYGNLKDLGVEVADVEKVYDGACFQGWLKDKGFVE